MDRGARQAIVQGVTESDMTYQLTTVIYAFGEGLLMGMTYFMGEIKCA